MKKKLNYILTLIIVLFLSQATHAGPKTDPDIKALEPCSSTYNAEPPFLSVSALPSTSLLIDFSGSLNEHAYQEEEVQWDTGTKNATAYTGFNSTREYYGYFDPYTYYEYSSGKFTNATGPSDSTWNGNFLNWATMHRIDILKKAMTGGNYNSTEGYYTVSKTDSLEDRGKYHVYNATSTVLDLNKEYHHVAPSNRRKLIGLEQGSSASNLVVHVMTQSSLSPITFTNNTVDATYSLNISSEQQYGILHYIGPNTRLALFTFADDPSNDDGGKVLHHMTSNATGIIDIINKQEPSSSNTDSPLAEALYTITGYVQQTTENIDNKGPRYNGNASYLVSDTADPFYFLNATHPLTGPGQLLSCTQQNIIIISDGISTYDKNLPELFTSNEFDAAEDNENCNLLYEGSCYLDDVAYWAHTKDLRDDIDGNNTVNIFAISLFSDNSTLLENAAKFGGFTDFDNDGVIDKTDWTADGDDIPDNFFDVSSGAKLEQALAVSMTGLINRASSGGSASVVSTSRRGEGLLYQAVFWPELIDGNGDRISWAGDVYAYWLDDAGILYEDDGSSNKTLASDDSKISIWYDTSDPSNKRSRACSNGTIIDGQCVNGEVKELTSVRHVWRASKWLNDVENPTQHRKSNEHDNSKRSIYTWIDDNDGKIESGEFSPFSTGNTALAALKIDSTDTPLVDNATINWIRGDDQTGSGLRSRQVYIDTNYDNIPDDYVTWRLGDVINSSPTIVASPSENYHLYWNSTEEGQSYAKFLAEYKNRRIMVYFGGNDGMLHAINGGFYSEKSHTYFNKKLDNGTLEHSNTALDIGAEMWAYVPYNLLPHLKCLTQKNYQHKYYVDLKPRVFDARVFPKTDKHPEGWGTILVCGFNFGGDGFQDKALTLDNKGNRYFGSSYFIFDVTDPESDLESNFLGEVTFDGSLPFGFSINAPTLVATKDDTSKIYWYLLFGNGPNYTNGATIIQPQAFVVPLHEFVEKKSTYPLRPTKDMGEPSITDMGIIGFGKTIGEGQNLRACVSTGFVSIDYDFDFFVDMLYYGLVTTEGENEIDRNGGMHRLKLDEKNFLPSKWAVMKMLQTDQPITAAPNAAVKDVYGKTGSIWVYSGTGIFWDKAQKNLPDEQWIFGVEEKRKDQAYDFATRNWDKLHDVTDIEVLSGGEGILQCKSGSTCDIPSGYDTVEKLGDYIQNTNSVEGWKRKLSKGERVLGQPTLFGGLTNFTTFTPSSDLCSAEGSSTLYALYYRTGTAWKENVFGTATGDIIPDSMSLGQGMGITPSLHLGSEEGVRVYVQTSTGSIIEIHQPNLPLPGVKSGSGGWHTLEVD